MRSLIMQSLSDLKYYLRKNSSVERAQTSKRFFKTGKGEYGEGDEFLGLAVPDCRKIAKRFINIELDDLKKHLESKYHEERLVALLILFAAERYISGPLVQYGIIWAFNSSIGVD